MTEGGTELAKDLSSYQALRERTKNRSVANSLIEEVSTLRKTIDKKKLFNEQTMILSEINRNLPSEVFNNFVSDYRHIGNIYLYFSGAADMPIKQRVSLREAIINDISNPEAKKSNTLEPVDSITYSIMIRKFNEKYSNNLNEHQKALIRTYLCSDKDDTEFKVYLNEELGRLKGILSTQLQTNKNIIEDSVMVENGKKIMGILENIHINNYTDDMVQSVMKIQKLVEEMDND
jgi:hypothetical protein